jgi:predicted short-subunit dehydrogenase-like oxidoreductase (DUF2520 family)
MKQVLIVGAGRLAATLLADLAAAGTAALWWARPSLRRDAVQQWLAGQRLLAPPRLIEPTELAQSRADVLILAVTDGQIGPLARQLADAGLRAAVVLHCAGALAVEPLRVGLSPACGSCHPLAAVADPLLAATRQSPLRHALFAIDGDEAAQLAAQQLSAAWGGFTAQVAGPQRAAYHAAAALIANDWVALADSALRTVVHAGLAEPELRRGLLHLAGTALLALQAVPADQPLLRGLTGAVARGDGGTLQRHLETIDDAQIRELHRLASLILAKRCAQEGQISPQVAEQLAAALHAP